MGWNRLGMKFPLSLPFITIRSLILWCLFVTIKDIFLPQQTYQVFIESVWTNDWFIFTWNAFFFYRNTCLSPSMSLNLGGNICTNRKIYNNLHISFRSRFGWHCPYIICRHNFLYMIRTVTVFGENSFRWNIIGCCYKPTML